MTWETLAKPGRPGLMLALFLGFSVVAYILWKITESPVQALQVTFNGLNVGAVYALLAMGFTLVYSTVWFFDLYYGAAAAMGAYGVFYPRWSILSTFRRIPWRTVRCQQHRRQCYLWSRRHGRRRLVAPHGVLRAAARAIQREMLRFSNGVVAVAAGLYTGYVLTYPDNLGQVLAPAIFLTVGISVALTLNWALKKAVGDSARAPIVAAIGGIVGVIAGGLASLALFDVPESNLYLSWVVSCLLAGCVGLALYRGLYFFMLARAKSTLIMLVGSLGVLLTISALIVIVFSSAPRALPAALGSEPILIGGASIKGFALFSIAAAFVGFGFMWLLLQKTSLGKVIRAIGDDEQVAKVVGINTTAIIAAVLFIGAVYAALQGS